MSHHNQITCTSVKSEAMSTTVLQDGIDKKLESGHFYVDLNHAEVQKLGLPITACKDNHYIKAHLFVTASGPLTGMPAHRIGQTLLFTPCDDTCTEIYTRTGELNGNNAEWTPWVKIADATNNVNWNSHSHIDTYTTAGIYNITGERTNATDGLPIVNAAPGHTFHARLQVLDCSIPGTGENDDKCITQMLTLSNRTGGDGDVYVRTGRAANKNQLAAGNGWEPWGKLQQNIEVGQTTSLDAYIDNGIYSGVYTDGSTHFETFVMVVINNYAVAGAMGNARSISQFKYALGTDGLFSHKTRTGQGNDGITWGNWVDLGAATTTDIQDGAITAQKLSADIRPNVENPLRPLYIAAGAEYNDSGVDKTKTAPWGEIVTHKAGHYYLNGLGDITEEQMVEIYNAGTLKNNIPGFYTNNNRVRTILPARTSGQEGFGTVSLNGILSSATSVESVVFTDRYSLAERLGVSFSAGTAYSAFSGCSNLVYIQKMNFSSVATLTSVFDKCNSLVYANINGLKCNLNWGSSVMISKESVIYTIQNAFPVSAITITLHPDAYARLADDVDIVAALEAQPLISLVSA